MCEARLFGRPIAIGRPTAIGRLAAIDRPAAGRLVGARPTGSSLATAPRTVAAHAVAPCMARRDVIRDEPHCEYVESSLDMGPDAPGRQLLGPRPPDAAYGPAGVGNRPDGKARGHVLGELEEHEADLVARGPPPKMPLRQRRRERGPDLLGELAGENTFPAGPVNARLPFPPGHADPPTLGGAQHPAIRAARDDERAGLFWRDVGRAGLRWRDVHRIPPRARIKSAGPQPVGDCRSTAPGGPYRRTADPPAASGEPARSGRTRPHIPSASGP